MRAVQIATQGGPEVLDLVDLSTPDPGIDEVRVRVTAAGVNFIDIYKRSGAYPMDLPAIAGEEAAGVVDAVGDGIADIRIGDRVAFTDVEGAYADYVVVPAKRLVTVPREIDLETAAAALLQGLTAHYLTHTTFPLTTGHIALVTAAAGGVGQLLVQTAKRRGARVIGTVSTDEKAALARQAGADEVVRYIDGDVVTEVRRLTGDRGVDVVYDSVGQATFSQSLDVLRPRGVLVLYGQSSGRVPPLDPQELNRRGSLYLTRPSLTHHIAEASELLQRAADLFHWIATGQLHVRIDRRFGLHQAADAHRYIESRQTKGKVLVIPDGLRIRVIRSVRSTS